MKTELPCHCPFKIIKRSKNESVIKKAAYNTREKLFQEETGKYISYRSKEDLLAKGILAPKNAPSWVFNREKMYNKVEAIDYRKNSQLGRTIEISLMHPLSLEQNKELLERYLQTYFVNEGMIADYVIHAPSKEGDQRNIHAHVILSMRQLEGEEFGKKKERKWNNPKLVTLWREAWAMEVNQTFDRLDLPYFIDHRSHKERGIDKIPQKHEGKRVTNVKRREGIRLSRAQYNDLVKAANKLADEIDELKSDEDWENTEAGQQTFTSLIQQSIALSERVESLRKEEEKYWEDLRDLEDEQTKQKYQDLEHSSDQLAKELLNLVEEERRRKPDKDSAVQDLDSEPARRSPHRKIQSEGDAVQKTDSSPPPSSTPPDTPQNQQLNQTDERQIKQRRQAVHMPKSNKTVREQEALKISRRVASRKTNIEQVRNPVTAYRLKLAEFTKDSDPESVAKSYRSMDNNALECDRRIRDFMRRRGFSEQEIRKAMRRASPALYRKSKSHADLYARRFNEWARKQQQEERKNRQQKQRAWRNF